jgi:hypothetical protein
LPEVAEFFEVVERIPRLSRPKTLFLFENDYAPFMADFVSQCEHPDVQVIPVMVDRLAIRSPSRRPPQERGLRSG